MVNVDTLTGFAEIGISRGCRSVLLAPEGMSSPVRSFLRDRRKCPNGIAVFISISVARHCPCSAAEISLTTFVVEFQHLREGFEEFPVVAVDAGCDMVEFLIKKQATRKRYSK